MTLAVSSPKHTESSPPSLALSHLEMPRVRLCPFLDSKEITHTLEQQEIDSKEVDRAF